MKRITLKSGMVLELKKTDTVWDSKLNDKYVFELKKRNVIKVQYKAGYFCNDTIVNIEEVK